MRLAFLVPAPEYPEPWRWAFDAEAQALIDAGIVVDPVAWTEAGDLGSYDLILPLVAWGYHLRYAEWLAFLDRLEAEALPVANPPALLRWSSDKSYLAELGDKDIPTVPSLVVERLDRAALEQAASRFCSERLVVKPLVSASAAGTFRLGVGDEIPASVAGERMIVQPLVQSISAEGEYSLMLFDGVFSHAVVKRPKAGDFRVQPHLGGVTIACDPPVGGIELAKVALAAAPAEATYARVDMVRSDEGELQIMELELVEPALFLPEAPDRGAAFARSVLRAAESSREEPLAKR